MHYVGNPKGVKCGVALIGRTVGLGSKTPEESPREDTVKEAGSQQSELHGGV